MVSLLYLCFALLGYFPGSAPSVPLILRDGQTVRAPSVASKYRASGGPVHGSAEQASCRKFVGEFYAWYLARARNGDPLRVALRQKKMNFSPELTRALNEDAKAAARSPNEIVGLDFDPILNSQDVAEKYIPGKVTQKGSRVFIDVASISGGKRSEVPTVIPELRHEHGQWVFTNSIYKIDGKTNDLLSLLSQLKADRKRSRQGSH